MLQKELKFRWLVLTEGDARFEKLKLNFELSQKHSFSKYYPNIAVLYYANVFCLFLFGVWSTPIIERMMSITGLVIAPPPLFKDSFINDVVKRVPAAQDMWNLCHIFFLPELFSKDCIEINA